MIIFAFILLGLCFGSFVNALVWRMHEQQKTKNKKQKTDYSIRHGRSMCPNCRHQLSASDLMPVVSWLVLRAKCRYCNKPISWQYPLVELATSLLFVLSWTAWPYGFDAFGVALFIIWLAMCTILTALIVYDLKWMILPNRLIFPLIGLAGVSFGISLVTSNAPGQLILGTFFGLLVGAGIFYGLFQISHGRWIGGGDVKLAFAYGLLLSSPIKSALVLFMASIIGSIAVLPQLINRKLTLSAKIPFGPLLIIAVVVVYLWGDRLIRWYQAYLGLI